MDHTSGHGTPTPNISTFPAHSMEAPADESNKLPSGVQSGCHVPYEVSPDYYLQFPQPIVHYVPPSAISTRYYTLSDPNLCPVTAPTGAHPGTPLPTIVATTTVFPALQTAVTANVALDTTPTTSRSRAGANPVLPKQSRNRDDPGGESRPLAQPTPRPEEQTARIPGTLRATRVLPTGSHSQRAELEPPPAIVPSQWQLGAALDDLRFKDRARPNTGSTSTPDSQNHPAAAPSSAYQLSAEDTARLARIKTMLGIDVDGARAGPSSSPTMSSPTASTPGASTDGEYNMNKAAIYSPTTGRKLPLSGEPGKSPVQIMPGTTLAKRPYKRGTPIACVFCRKRKIACGGPHEGDAARRCGPCIQRAQACEFPATASRPLSRVPHAVGYTGPVIVREFK
ncbi:hypothetical protein BC628DRAFT_1423256 [Trametes gibbosa]|nr:hypothetical protein BC628DRAFT_1423256 [Trametes gibbosa]